MERSRNLAIDRVWMDLGDGFCWLLLARGRVGRCETSRKGCLTIMAGRPRKPNAIHEISGAKAKNPARFRERVEEPETKGPIGDPPATFLSPYGDGPKLLAKWHKLIDEAPIGVLTASDSEYLALLCRMAIESERTGSKGYRQAMKDYLIALKDMGGTPGGRAARGLGGKVNKAATPDNPLDRFSQAKRLAG